MKTPRSLFLPFLALAVTIGSLPALAQPPAPGGMEHAHAKSTPSTEISVTVDGKTTTFHVAELEALPQKTVAVHNAHNNADETYTGVLLTDVFTRVAPGALGKSLLRSYVKAAGTDQYWVLYSGIEIDPASHAGQVIVATTLDGKPLAADGAFKLVSSEDSKPQRWVRNLAGLTLVKAE